MDELFSPQLSHFRAIIFFSSIRTPAGSLFYVCPIPAYAVCIIQLVCFCAVRRRKRHKSSIISGIDRTHALYVAGWNESGPKEGILQYIQKMMVGREKNVRGCHKKFFFLACFRPEDMHWGNANENLITWKKNRSLFDNLISYCSIFMSHSHFKSNSYFIRTFKVNGECKRNRMLTDSNRHRTAISRSI